MSRAALLAALAAVAGVLAAWNALAAVERGRAAAALSRLVEPLRRAGGEGREPTPPERRRLAVLAAGGLGAAGWLVAGPLAGAGVAMGGPWVAVTLVRARRRRYAAGLGRAAPLVARALADALAGGHSVRGAVQAAADGGVVGPAGRELRGAAGALALGEPTDDVLERLRLRARAGAARGPFDTIVAAVMLQRDAGGDLAGLLRGVADALDEAARVEDDARAATAQARFTGLIVTALPVGAALLAELASPGYLSSLTRSPLTAWLAACAVLFQAGALLLIARLARVKG